MSRAPVGSVEETRPLLTPDTSGQYPQDIVSTCGQHHLAAETAAMIDSWQYYGVPNEAFQPGSERMVPGIGWTWSPLPKRDKGSVKQVRRQQRELRANSYLWELHRLEALLRAVLGHVYIWKMCYPLAETEVPDPVRLFEGWNNGNFWEVESHPSSSELRRTRIGVHVTPSVRLCDIDIETRPGWVEFAESWVRMNYRIR